MQKISHVVEEILLDDEVASAAVRSGLLNLSAYARQIQPTVSKRLRREVQIGSVTTALSRISSTLPLPGADDRDFVQRLAVHSNLEGMTFERTGSLSMKLGELFAEASEINKGYVTVTQGINEITVVAESPVARIFRERLRDAHIIYDKLDLVGVTVKFDERYLQIPNLIFKLCRRLAQRSVNIIEIVSTATELTFIIEHADLSAALEQLQKDM